MKKKNGNRSGPGILSAGGLWFVQKGQFDREYGHINKIDVRRGRRRVK